MLLIVSTNQTRHSAARYNFLGDLQIRIPALPQCLRSLQRWHLSIGWDCVKTEVPLSRGSPVMLRLCVPEPRRVGHRAEVIRLSDLLDIRTLSTTKRLPVTVSTCKLKMGTFARGSNRITVLYCRLDSLRRSRRSYPELDRFGMRSCLLVQKSSAKLAVG